MQADGELLGPTPTEISIVPEALTLLIPPEAEAASAWRNPPIPLTFRTILANLNSHVMEPITHLLTGATLARRDSIARPRWPQ